MATLSPAAELIAGEVYISADGNTALLRSAHGSGPKDAYDALEARTGTRGWTLTAISGDYFTYTRN